MKKILVSDKRFSGAYNDCLVTMYGSIGVAKKEAKRNGWEDEVYVYEVDIVSVKRVKPTKWIKGGKR